jgi:hypothetical protein
MNRAKEKAEELCWVCIHHKVLVGKEASHVEDDLFPIEPYCEKGHSKLDFSCGDFEADNEKLRRMINDMVDCRYSIKKLK